MKHEVPVLPFLTTNKAIMRTNALGNITEWGESAEKLLGYSEADALGQNISKLLFTENLPFGYGSDHFSQKIEKNIYEMTAITKNDQKVYLSIERSSIKNKNGIITGFSISVQSIPKLNIPEDKEAIFESIVNLSGDGIISKTLDGIITSWNRAATNMFGFSEEEAIGQHISIIIPPDRLEEDDFIIEQIKSGNKLDYVETVRIAKNGNQKNVELFITPIQGKNGQISGASIFIRDLSIKNEIDEKRAILAAIVDSSDDAIISKTTDGIITSWNHSATTMFGFSEEEAIGQHISIIIPPERLEEETLIINNIRNGNKVDHFETERISKDGTIKSISVTVSPIRNNKGIIIGASKTARDISAKIDAEKQRELYTKGLQELNQYKDEFMVMASHELKTPVTVILANLQILKLLLEGDANNAFVDKTLKQMLKLSDLIGNLFDVSKIQAGKLVLNVTSFDIDLLIKDVAANMQQTTLNHRILYTSNPGIIASADRYKIEQVVVNLVSNAIKYMTEPGDIHLRIDKTENSLVFRITDNGVGIPKKDIENIFQRFFRVSGPASSFSGSGVGLYISSEIIKAHGGKIWAESEIGKGATFYFSIPVS